MAFFNYCVTSKFQRHGAIHSRGFSATTEHRYISISSPPANPCRLNHEVLGHQPRLHPIRRATQISAVSPPGPGGLPPAGGKPPLPNPFPNTPSWVTWLVGAIFVAVPAYWQIRALQDKVEQTAEAAIKVVEKVAEAAEKITEDVAEEFPGNESIKKAASRIKAVADEIEKDADKAEALLHKVDQIEEEVDEMVDSFTKKKSERKNP